MQGHVGKNQGGSGVEGEGEHGPEPFGGSHRKEWVRQDKYAH